MTDKITDKELELAAHVNELSDAAERPVVAGGGLLAAATNFLMRRVSRGILAALLVVFCFYHGWEAYNGSLQNLADLQTKRAEAGSAIAEATALNAKTERETLALASMRADLAKLEQQAAAAQVEADAQNTVIGEASVKLLTLRAEIDKARAEALAAKVEADAQLQKINGLPAAVAQKKAEVETAEEEVRAQIEVHRSLVVGAISGIRRGPLLR